MKSIYKLITLALLVALTLVELSIAQTEDNLTQQKEMIRKQESGLENEFILQKETIRRQELVLRATKELDTAQQLIETGKDAEARKLIANVLDQIPNAAEGKPVYSKASAMLSFLDYKAALKKFNDKDYFEARKLAQSAVKFNPANLQAQKIINDSNKALGIKKGDAPENPSVDPKFVENLNKVNEHIENAKNFSGTGQFQLAEKELEQALAIDPYNKVAAKDQEKLFKKMGKSFELAQQSSRQERLTQTREGWSEVFDVDVQLSGAQNTAIPIKGRANFQVSQKLQSLIISEVDFKDASIEDAARFLTTKSREVDETGAGISFIVKNEKAKADAKPFSLRLSNVPIGEVLRYICNIAGVKFKVEEFAVFIVPLSDGDDAILVTREFPVRDTFFDASNIASAADAGATNRRRPRTAAVDARTTDPIRKSLEDRGVQFPEGAAAIYNRATGTLTIKNTQDQVDLVEELVTIDQGETLLVRIETKLIEINQSDLDSLAFNYNLVGGYLPPPSNVLPGGTQIAGGNVSSGTNLLGAKGVQESDGINRFVNAASAVAPANRSVIPNRFGITGAIDSNRFAALMEALSQKSSTDLMTAPSVLVNDGLQASVLVARQFYYPTAFDQPAATISRTGADVIIVDPVNPGAFSDSSFLVIPSWPTEFQSRHVGVSMVVQPRITVDRQRVFLTLKPEVTEFDGFINYGAEIRSPFQADIEDPLNPGQFIGALVSPNTINQPVFTTRIVENAQLEIQDGYTMVLGGLIREDISTVEDKVPILGDLPLVGRLFRSKAEQAIKKNMLIFVSVRILRPDGEPYNATVATKLAAKP